MDRPRISAPSVSPGTYSMAMNGCPRCSPTSKMVTMCSWASRPAARASRVKRSRATASNAALEQLHRHQPIDQRIAREVNLAHASAAEQPDGFEPADAVELVHRGGSAVRDRHARAIVGMTNRRIISDANFPGRTSYVAVRPARARGPSRRRCAMVETLLNDVRYALRGPGAQSRVLRRRHPLAGARRRRQHGDVLAGRRAAVPAAAGRRTRRRSWTSSPPAATATSTPRRRSPTSPT